ncbi:transcription elongation factor GreA [Alphaproteobacteria bacterium]|nr:transcription elongation factor GreA [Alphaproteobacteria bacterium]|tara:strand:- start:108 stop:581 length:474 start_codon:yes stop_codon:yes gene_type:complete
MDKVPMTTNSYAILEEELKKLKSEDRPNVIKAIAEAREHGDLSENAEYHAAKEQQSFIEGRILELEYKVTRAEVIDTSSIKSNKILFGATINLIDEKTKKEITYKIVGVDETNVEKGLISVSSPVARSLMGKMLGDIAVVNTPGGKTTYEILNIQYI